MLVVPTFRLQEKPHIVNKLPLLTPEQKEQVNQFFATHRNIENQVDWNKGAKLTYQDFKKVMDANANTFKNKHKRVKQFGVQGLTQGKDYGQVETGNPNFIAVVPFSHESSRILASNGVGDTCEGEWCIAYQKNPKYWDDYTRQGDTFMFVMIPAMKEKFAFQIRKNQIDVWTPGDSRLTIQQFISICTNEGVPVTPQEVRKWCSDAEDVAEGMLERGPLFTEVDNSWTGWVNHENPQVFQMSYNAGERKIYEDGDTEEGEEYFDSTIHMRVISKDTLTQDMIREAGAVKFDLVSGHGLMFILPDNTMTPEQAQRKAYNAFNSAWGDLYDYDAVHELKKFLKISTKFGKEPILYRPDYLIFDSNAILEQLENDDIFMELITQAVQFSIPHADWESIEADNYTFISVNQMYVPTPGKNPINQVERPDGPVDYRDPNQQELQFERIRNRNLRMLMGEGAPFSPTN